MMIAQEIHKIFSEKGYTLATAESCTGGNIAHNITLMAGSSAYYLGGVVSYANEVKTGVLGVNKENIERDGAVSESVVREMSEGARRITDADFAVATSGIAGPGGGSAEKPVGTVWISASSPSETIAECHHFNGNRAEIIEKATEKAFFMLLSLAK